MSTEVVDIRRCAHGLGCFALRSFKKNEVIAIVSGGKLVSKPTSKFDMPINESEWWAGFPKDHPQYWSNFLDHSTRPNCAFVDFNKHELTARLVTLQKIDCGSELFIDYDARIDRSELNTAKHTRLTR
jgi:hypothetical protein